MKESENINVGDSVRITEYGYTYAGNSPWILKNAPDQIDNFKDGYLPKNNYICKVIFKAQHSQNTDIILYLLSFENRVFVMDSRGFKLERKSFEVELIWKIWYA